MSYLDPLYDLYSQYAPNSIYFHMILAPLLVAIVTYYTLGTLLLPLDFYEGLRLKLIGKKCQPNKSVDPVLLKKVLSHVTFQLVFLYPIFLAILFPILSNRLSTSKEDLPDLKTTAMHLPIYVLSAETVFFYNHWLLHTPWFYKRVHKFHHTIKAPFGFAGIYLHWWEAFSNLWVILAGPAIVKAHFMETSLWVAIVVGQVTFHHSGYDLPLDGAPPFLSSMAHFHDYHHQFFDKCFGVIGLFDWIHGTGHTEYTKYVDEWDKERKEEKRPENWRWGNGAYIKKKRNTGISSEQQDDFVAVGNTKKHA